MKEPVRALARRIDHALLHPTLTDEEFAAGCSTAKKWAVAAVCVKSADVERARALIQDGDVAICAVVGFPHGNAPPAIVRAEAEHALSRGATEIDVVAPLSRILSGDWQVLTDAIVALNSDVTRAGGILKVIFETGLIGDRARKIRLCQICKDAGVAFVKTSTGFAFARGADGATVALGATLDDVRLLAEHAGPVCKVKASGGIRTFGEAAAFLEAGADRLGTTSTESILSAASRD